MWRQIKGLLFDKDGTLFDHDATWVAWIQAVVRRLAPDQPLNQQKLLVAAGLDVETNSFMEGGLFVAGTSDDLLPCWQKILPDLEMAKLEAIGFEEMQNAPSVPVCDLPVLLAGFRASGLALGVATNDYEVSARKQLDDAGITDYFDVIMGFDSGPTPKPEPDMVLSFCEQMKLRPDQVAMIGDSTHDLDAGRTAGARTIGVLTGPAGANGLAAADVVLPNISHLPTLLGLSD